METALRTHVRKILRAIAAFNAAEEAKIRKLEAEGYRIVDGGQVDGDGWEVHDWRTGERFASGTGGYKGYCTAAAALDPEGRWFHKDQVGEDWGDYDISATTGIPESLADALVDWAETAPAEDVAQVASWPCEEVERCLRNSQGPSQ